MSTKNEQKIKAQEWVVMFDGQIKKSEKEIDSQRDEALNQLKSEADNLGDLIVERLLAKK